MKKLQEIIKEFPLEDVYNFGETETCLELTSQSFRDYYLELKSLDSGFYLESIFDKVGQRIGQGFMEFVGRINNRKVCQNESKGDSFQDKINQTMNKLQNSSEQVDYYRRINRCIYGRHVKTLENMGLTEDNIDGIIQQNGLMRSIQNIKKTIIEGYELPDFNNNNGQQDKAIINLVRELQELGQPSLEILQRSNIDLRSNCKPM
nr:11072_t:CDS:2 [Entrophospora candida]